MHLRVASLQYDPLLREVERNIERVDGHLVSLRPGDVDILVLPEMAFSGYMFSDRDEIEPFLEDESGTSISWAKTKAKLLACHGLVGFPEKGSNGLAHDSLAVVGPSGDLQVKAKLHHDAVRPSDNAVFRWSIESISCTTPTRRGRRPDQASRCFTSK